MASAKEAYTFLQNTDSELYDILKREISREDQTLELIASENFVSYPVLEMAGGVMTNKYAEGYPGARYYGGCEHVDEAENLARIRAQKLFNCEYANVQPHSGSQANMAAYFSLVKPGDTVLSLELSHGGHLTHGHPLSFSGALYNIIPYGVNKDTEQFDYEEIRKLALEHKPKMILTGASAYPRKIDFKKFREIADEVGATLFIDMAHIAGLVAAGQHENPIPYADIVTTTTHKTLRGPRGGMILCKEEYAKEIDKQVFPGIQGGPLEHVIAAKAAAFKEALQDDFKIYQEQVVKNAEALAKALEEKGLRLVSGGTDTHLMLIDLGNKDSGNPSGKKMEGALDKAGITANKNTVPFDSRPPFVASGIRLGTPAVTTRGMKEKDMQQIAEFIAQVFSNHADEDRLAQIKNEVREFCSKFPLYPELLDQD